mgnify:CR=1 FL=1
MPMFMIIALDIFITMHFSINCSAVICSPTIIHAIMREATSETYAPGSLSYYIASLLLSHHLYYFAIFTFQSIQQNTKNIYLIISVRSHVCKWPWRDWQPLYHVGCKVLDSLCRYWVTCALSPTGLIPWFSKTELNTYATLLHHPFLFKGKPTQCSRGSTRQ